MADALTLERYDAEREGLEIDQLAALHRLEVIHPELRWWYARLAAGRADSLADGPADPALWRAIDEHQERSRGQFRAAYDAARLRQAQLHYDEVQLLCRWAWECDSGLGACTDVLSPPAEFASEHMARHKHAVEVLQQAIVDASWPVLHWRRHLDQRRCVLVTGMR